MVYRTVFLVEVYGPEPVNADNIQWLLDNNTNYVVGVERIAVEVQDEENDDG